MARAGVVIVHFGEKTPTGACVRALLGDRSAAHRTIIVVDNSANLQPTDVAGATLLTRPDNPGFGAGANLGVAALGEGPWDALVVLNHDIEVASGFLQAAVDALSGARVGAAAGPLYLDQQRERLWYGGGGVNFLTGTVWQVRSPRGAGGESRVGFLPGAAMAIGEAAWRDVGGFDPGYFLYHEDLDLCLRLRRRGWQLRFAPGMAAVHHLGAATGSGASSPFYLEHLTRTRLRPFRPFAYRLYLAVLHTGYVLLRAGRCLLAPGGGGRTAAGALLRGHRHALATLREGPRNAPRKRGEPGTR